MASGLSRRAGVAKTPADAPGRPAMSWAASSSSAASYRAASFGSRVFRSASVERASSAWRHANRKRAISSRLSAFMGLAAICSASFVRAAERNCRPAMPLGFRSGLGIGPTGFGAATAASCSGAVAAGAVAAAVEVSGGVVVAVAASGDGAGKWRRLLSWRHVGQRPPHPVRWMRRDYSGSMRPVPAYSSLWSSLKSSVRPKGFRPRRQ